MTSNLHLQMSLLIIVFTRLLVGLEGIAQAANLTSSPSGSNLFLHVTNFCFSKTITGFCIYNLKILIFTGPREYVRNPDNSCNPGERLTSTNVNAAKEECDSIPSCHMFYNYKGNGKSFYACENTASVQSSAAGSILYQVLSGNKWYMQYEYFRDIS